MLTPSPLHSANARTWDNLYAGTGSAHKNRYPSERVVGWVLRNMPRGSRGLDVGCGWGNHLRFLLAEGYDAHGMDFAASAVSALQGEFGDRVQHESALRTHWPEASFDFVIDRCSIQHNPIDDLPAIMGEMARVLKPGGRFFSELRRIGDDGLAYAGPDEAQLRAALQPFADVQIDLMTRTERGGQMRFESWLIDAVR